jgi:hypothetical protein
MLYCDNFPRHPVLAPLSTANVAPAGRRISGHKGADGRDHANAALLMPYPPFVFAVETPEAFFQLGRE